ncbi:thiopurine S-methyltransferase, Se/Te detoxification family [Thioflavicoccus mobilis 8321]|uniref:Thiopurine S-methyltransferase n=1 Tax=Thioflavicoccus mobilis 8321 TaxID=765912 RepID=L0GV32_9GAMM|nr:thiopurine S-methyltransferase [Thioflavicoccus mobilis]AGA89687.1 thiopurine S-methyltransferase, Se/Te detoxification family [Thioflavicoccus mobilis 8321]
MQPDFWHARWQRGETGWHEEQINVHLQQLWPRLGLAAETRVFVPLCGKSRDLLWLAGRGHRVLGVELSEIAVQAFFDEQGLRPKIDDEPPFRRYAVDEMTLLCGDFFDLRPEHLAGISAFYDRASLIALPPALRGRYATHLKTLLPATTGLLITLDYDQTKMAGPPFSVQPGEVERLFGDRFTLTAMADLDLIGESPKFRQRGLTTLREHVWRLDPRG